MKRKCGVIPTHFARTAREHVVKRNRQHFKTRALPCVKQYFLKMRGLLRSEVSTSKLLDKIR